MRAWFVLVLCAYGAGQTPPSKSISPDPAAALNSQLPRWVRFSGEERIRLEGFAGGGFLPANNDAYLLQRFRLQLNLLAKPWLSFHFQSQDARVFWKTQQPYAPPFQDTWDLRQAYMELGSGKTPIGLRLGRQELAFGDERLVGTSYWGNTGRSFDAVRLTLRHKFLQRDGHADIFAASVVALHDGDVGDHQAGNNFHGVNAGIDKLFGNANLEGFGYWRLAPRLKNESGLVANLNEKTAGFRLSGKAGNTGYSFRIALQRGSLGSDSVSAWSGHWLTNYRFPKWRWSSQVMAEGNYASGDGNPHDGIRQTFDNLYPSVHDKAGLADQIGIRNIGHVRTGADFKPAKEWSAGVKYSWFWLANGHDALYATGGAIVAQRADGSAGSYVGQELDFTVVRALSKTLQAGAGVGHLFPGEFLKKTTPGHAYTYPYLVLTYGF